MNENSKNNEDWNQTSDRPLKVEVLVNSLGPHERVRIREPFFMLQRMGISVRLHRHPFHLPSCIQPHSMVIWQRPLPESWQQQINLLRWFRSRGCLLLTEWDDHPDLMPIKVLKHLNDTMMAPIRGCHILHTSSSRLARELQHINPLSVVIGNATRRQPEFNADKHINCDNVRIFVGNQNREQEHQRLASNLRAWCKKDSRIKIVIINDYKLASRLPQSQTELHPLCKYQQYRALLASCHLALLPLEKTTANACKTPIKWIEAASESTVCIAGPELYGSVIDHGHTGWMVEDLDQMVSIAELLHQNTERRVAIANNAYRTIKAQYGLLASCEHRIWLYKHLWRSQKRIDRHLITRLPAASNARHFNT
jgi:hypothetical protein